MDEHNVPGLAVVVRLSDGSCLERYMGYADIATKRPIDGQTVFQVMSITKPATAMVCVLLAQQGVIDLDAPVATYLRSWTIPRERCEPGCDFAGVTLRRILAHHAGLNVHGFGWAPAHGPHPVGAVRPRPIELLDGICGEPLRLATPPGSEWRYSGGGYGLAEVVIEDVCGKPFAHVAKQLLLSPAGMHGSDYEPTEDIRSRLASRYIHDPSTTSDHPPRTRDDPPRHLVTQPHFLIASCAGSGLYATARDACRLAELCIHSTPKPRHRSRSAREFNDGPVGIDVRDIIEPHMLVGRDRWMGLGFHLWLKRSERIFAHRGYKEGWWSEVIGLARRRCAIAVLTNGDDQEQCAKTLALELRQCFLNYSI